MKCLIAIALIFICGCDDTYGVNYKCIDGIVYVMTGGIWIETKLYGGNKCFSDKPETASKKERKQE